MRGGPHSGLSLDILEGGTRGGLGTERVCQRGSWLGARPHAQGKPSSRSMAMDRALWQAVTHWEVRAMQTPYVRSREVFGDEGNLQTQYGNQCHGGQRHWADRRSKVTQP